MAATTLLALAERKAVSCVVLVFMMEAAMTGGREMEVCKVRRIAVIVLSRAI